MQNRLFIGGDIQILSLPSFPKFYPDIKSAIFGRFNRHNSHFLNWPYTAFENLALKVSRALPGNPTEEVWPYLSYHSRAILGPFISPGQFFWVGLTPSFVVNRSPFDLLWSFSGYSPGFLEFPLFEEGLLLPSGFERLGPSRV